MDTPVGNEAPPQGRRVVIVAGGFGGLTAAKELRRADAEVPGLATVAIQRARHVAKAIRAEANR
jgi:NADH dehydrogenase FAD-containing subunit